MNKAFVINAHQYYPFAPGNLKSFLANRTSYHNHPIPKGEDPV